MIYVGRLLRIQPPLVFMFHRPKIDAVYDDGDNVVRNQHFETEVF